MSSHPENPFRGLQPFQQEDQDKLFGRDLDLILMKDRIFSCRTTLLFAGSGVGKTSFLNAKVIPALQKQYCVVLHNRWTGADERNDEEFWDDRPQFKIWPPQAFAQWLTELLFSKFFRRHSTAPPPFDSRPPKTPADNDKLTAEVRSVLSQSLRAGENGQRLPQVLASFKKSIRAKTSSGGVQKNCILILDQFEEVFQYHAFEDYFKDFISDLCEVINNEDYQVRIVFSLREEFLGELSIFDNRIPDLFNNYYRLRYPEKDEARDIILQTCHLAKVEADPEKLELLVGDLSTIEKGFSESRQGTATSATTRFLRRNFVPPPYLQIVCDRLWKEQFNNSAPPANQVEIDTQSNGSARFLQNYRSNSHGSDQLSESDAQRAVRTFCEEKLSPPFLNKWEQHLAARAFGFLVTRQGAKMAYELNSLARHMDERVWQLKHTLQKLSSPDARILRESRGPEGSYWFELYHDMYAGVVERWKQRFQRESRRRIRTRFAVSLALLAAVTLVPLSFLYWYKWPSDYEKIITDYRNTLNTTDLPKDEGFNRVVVAYSRLSATLGYSGRANRLWAEIWQRRAQLFEAGEKRDEALICLLQAAVLAQGYPAEKAYIEQANNLFAENEEAIKATYCTDCKFYKISADAKYLLTIANNGIVSLWNPPKLFPLSTLCLDCEDAVFTADGKSVATVSPIKVFESTNQGNRLPGYAELRLETDLSKASPSPPPNSTAQPSATPSTYNVVGWNVSISPIDSDAVVNVRIRRDQNVRSENPARSTDIASAFQLKTVSKSSFGYLVAAVLDGELGIWREDGSLFNRYSLPATYNLEDLRNFDARFSADGRFFSTYETNKRFWEVTATGLAASKKITSFATSSGLLISPDGRNCLTIDGDGRVQLWELPAQKPIFNDSVNINEWERIGFTEDGKSFYIAFANGTTRLCDRHTLTCVVQQRNMPSATSRFDADGKHILRMRDTVIEKWSVAADNKVGELQITELGTNDPTWDGSMAIQSGPFVRLWDVPPLTTSNLFAPSSSDLFYEDLSKDGETLLTVSTIDKNDRATNPTVWNAVTKTPIGALNNKTGPQVYGISGDGLHVAGASRPDKNVEIFAVSNPLASHAISFKSEVEAYNFSPDNKFLVVGTSSGEVSLIDTASYQITKTIQTDAQVLGTGFSSSSNYLLLVKANPNLRVQKDQEAPRIPALEIWSVGKGERVAIHLDPKERIQSYHTSDNDRLLVIQNQRLLIWNLTDGSKLRDESYQDDIAFGTFSRDGKLIALADTKGNVSLYNVESGARSSAVSLGSAAHEIFFAGDNVSLVVITKSWLHNIAIEHAKLRYLQGILTGNIVTASVRWLERSKPGQSNEPATMLFRWLRHRNRSLETLEASTDGKLSKPVLQGAPKDLLEAWSNRLSLDVDSLSYLAPKFYSGAPVPAPR